MSKRNITHRSGKQLYLNQIFLKGMLYTSSEMQEGFAKVIDNYDISPTGDAASPRQPFIVPLKPFQSFYEGKYIFPVKFKQLKNAQAYVRFKRTISEDEFTSDEFVIFYSNPSETIDILYRNDNAFNDGSFDLLTQVDYTTAVENDTEIPDESEESLDKDTNVVGVEYDNGTITVTDLSERDKTNTPITIVKEDPYVLEKIGNNNFMLYNNSMDFYDKYPCTISLNLRLNPSIVKQDATLSNILYTMKNDKYYANTRYQLSAPQITSNDSMHFTYIRDTGETVSIKISDIELKQKGEYGDTPFVTGDKFFIENPLNKIVEASISSRNNPFIQGDNAGNYNNIAGGYPFKTFFGIEMTTSDYTTIRVPDIRFSDFEDIPLESIPYERTPCVQINIYGTTLEKAVNNLSKYLNYNTAFFVFAKYLSGIVEETITVHTPSGDKDVEDYFTINTNFKTEEQRREETSFDYLLENDSQMQTTVSSIDIELKRHVQNRKKEMFQHDNVANITVVDGDTFEAGDKKYRLWAADSVEKGYKWYYYSKWFLHSLLANTAGDETYLDFKYKSTSYDREVSDISIYKGYTIRTNTESIIYEYTPIVADPLENITFYTNIKKDADTDTVIETFYTNIQRRNIFIATSYDKYFTNISRELYFNSVSLTELCLKTGLYTLRTGIENYATEDEIKVLSEYQGYALQNEYYRWWQDSENTELYFTDPYYNIGNIIIEVGEEDTTLKITDDMYIEAVKMYDEYNISAVTKTKLDYVHAIYIDYLDAVGFIGRVISRKTKNIVYKGLILLKADQTDSGQTYFRILLPNNQGEGYEPSILEAVESGYNLYNKELLHVKNTEYTDSPFALNGLAILKTNYVNGEPITDEDTPVITTQAVVGQTVSLTAVLNKGYYVNSGIYNTDKWGYNIHIEIPWIIFKNEEGVEVQAEKFNTIITKPLSNNSNIYYYSKNILDLLKEDTEYSTIDLSKINITKVELITPTNELVEITPVLSTISISSNSTIADVLVYDHSLFELKLKVTTNESRDYISISVYDNFNSPNKTLSSSSGNIELVDRKEVPSLTKEFYSQWSIADYGSENFEPLQDEVHIFNCVGSTLTSTGNSEDLLWTVTRSGILSFKFSIKPKIRISSDDTNPLNKYFITNSFEEIYQVYPRLNISNEIETVSTKSLTKNINIKNATRLDIFNRQLVLYGDGIGSNILQFSKFEYYDYYPFPLNTIELPEPIVYVTNYKDALIIFGKTSIFMLSGGASIQECTLNKIYENLSCKLPDIKLIKPIGNNLMFFNNGMGYIITPNTYVDSSSNIKVYKLTENISNFFYNPEEYIRMRLEEQKIPIDETPNYTISFDSYIENNTINIIANMEINLPNNSKKYYLTTIFIYNQDYRYWRMYSVDIFDSIIAPYICEPNLNTQFIVQKSKQYRTDNFFLAYIANSTNNYQDTYKDISTPIQTTLMSGYLSVDTMNDKRFKDMIIEFDKITTSNTLNIHFEFFVDSSPIILSSEGILVIDKLKNSLNNVSTDKILTDFNDYSAYHIADTVVPETTFKQTYGTVFQINNEKFSITGRTHVRIPVFGKGRLPSFVLKIKADKFYEFINYALIYKEKNINRRS